MEWWLAYLATGAAVGFLAGLLGIGGGAIMVPVLLHIFTVQGVSSAHVMHAALGTSMATILFTAASSAYAHHRRDGVDWPMARVMAPGILAGAFGAAVGAGFVPTRPLTLLVGVLMLLAATHMLLVEVKPKPHGRRPPLAVVFAAGTGIGAISSLLAVGGAFLSLPFLVGCGVSFKRAIGTASANGFPIALAGTGGYILQGVGAEGLPAWSLGYVNLLALALLVTASMLVAPLGAATAHRLAMKRLRLLSALLVYAVGARLLSSLI